MTYSGYASMPCSCRSRPSISPAADTRNVPVALTAYIRTNATSSVLATTEKLPNSPVGHTQQSDINVASPDRRKCVRGILTARGLADGACDEHHPGAAPANPPQAERSLNSSEDRSQDGVAGSRERKPAETLGVLNLKPGLSHTLVPVAIPPAVKVLRDTQKPFGTHEQAPQGRAIQQDTDDDAVRSQHPARFAHEPITVDDGVHFDAEQQGDRPVPTRQRRILRRNEDALCLRQPLATQGEHVGIDVRTGHRPAGLGNQTRPSTALASDV